ncbi:Beta-galactosidase BoGH2A [bacterium HR16]|nr:Beta-galactosidase BoGH2A [bacterium HR16]
MQLSLNGRWNLFYFEPGQGVQKGAHREDFSERDAIAVDVPGDVHTALIRAGILPDPYYDENPEACGWVEDYEWWYRTRFSVPSDMQGERFDLVFEGLDTLADIYLNGEKVGSAQNMFTPYRFDVTEHLRRGGENTLAICFHSVVLEAEKKDVSRYWAAFYKPRVWVRKAQMNWGWDWGPRFVTVGVWRPVRLEAHSVARIAHLFAHTLRLTENGAEVRLSAEIEAIGEEQRPLVVSFFVRDHGQDWGVSAPVIDGKAETTLWMDAPQLWWTHDLGKPHLYTVEAELRDGAKAVHADSIRFGVRTIEVDQSPGLEPETTNFTFVLNGVKIFAKGADWIPADNLIGSIPAERYRKLVQMARDANMNMLRVWGGGIYESPEFYDACDEMGVLVWQDFMFSCAAYPDDDEDFVKEVRREAEVVVKQLRNHPCIALWCGNNENQWIDSMIHWNEPEFPFFGKRIYDEVLPQVCAQHDPSRLYWHGSPWGGDDANSDKTGDKHNWQVWAGMIYPRTSREEPRSNPTPEGVSYRHYAHDRGRFISEFGMHGAPALRTLQRNIPPEQFFYDSEGFLYRIKDPDTSRKERMFEAHVWQPRDIQEFVLLSQFVQAEGLKFGIEHYRRRKFECSGALFWQLNDCWPGISWSVIDYYLNPKGAYHYVARAFAPLLYTFRQEEDGSVTLWGVNDRTEPASGDLRIRRMRLDGTVISEEEHRVQVPANSSQQLLRLAPATDPATEFLVVQVKRGHHAPDNVHFFAEWKHLKMPKAAVQAVFTPKGQEGSCWECELRSDKVAHFVHLVFPQDAVQVSDNYLLLLPGEPRTIEFTCPEPCDPRQVQVWGFNVGKVECEVRG